jgi:hypothetical protein
MFSLCFTFKTTHALNIISINTKRSKFKLWRRNPLKMADRQEKNR